MYIGLSYFFLVFGIVSVVQDLAQFLLAGKPRAYMKVLYFISSLLLLTGAYFSAASVHSLDPMVLQSALMDATLVPFFLHLWVQATAVALATGLIYCFSIVLTLLLLVKALFK